MDPRPGAIGSVPIHGPAEWGIRFGEFLIDGHDVAQHTFVLLDDDTVIGARPGPDGATILPLSHYDHVPIYWIDRELSPAARQLVVSIARSHEHERYDWWAYLWLASVRVGIRPAYVRKRMDDPDNDMCSQMADRIYRQSRAVVRVNLRPVGPKTYAQSDVAALTLFDDHRDPGNVTPGDLAAISDWTREPLR